MLGKQGCFNCHLTALSSIWVKLLVKIGDFTVTEQSQINVHANMWQATPAEGIGRLLLLGMCDGLGN